MTAEKQGSNTPSHEVFINSIPEEERPHLKERVQRSQVTSGGTIRPVPEFMEIGVEEMTWLSPGVTADLHWDNSPDIEKKIAKSRNTLKKALEQPLSKE